MHPSRIFPKATVLCQYNYIRGLVNEVQAGERRECVKTQRLSMRLIHQWSRPSSRAKLLRYGRSDEFPRPGPFMSLVGLLSFSCIDVDGPQWTPRRSMTERVSVRVEGVRIVKFYCIIIIATNSFLGLCVGDALTIAKRRSAY